MSITKTIPFTPIVLRGGIRHLRDRHFKTWAYIEAKLSAWLDITEGENDFCNLGAQTLYFHPILLYYIYVISRFV